MQSTARSLTAIDKHLGALTAQIQAPLIVRVQSTARVSRQLLGSDNGRLSEVIAVFRLETKR